MLRVWLLRRVTARKGTSWMVCRRQIPTGNLCAGRVIAVLYLSPLVDNNHSRLGHRGHLDYIGGSRAAPLAILILLLPITTATT